MSHKRFAPSSAKRDLACAGALAMIESMPASERNTGDNIHTRRGTCAHAVGEFCLTGYRNSGSATMPDSYIGMEVEGVIVDEKIAEGARVYVEFSKPIIDRCKKLGFVSIEERGTPDDWFDAMDAKVVDSDTRNRLDEINPDELGGTGDLVAGEVFGTLHVVDYKNGVGLVEHEGNSQGLDYAWFALSKYDNEYEFDKVCITIVQPNAFHEQGSCRTWETTPEEVYDWVLNKRLPGIQRNLLAIALSQGGQHEMAQLEGYLEPGEEQCMWCPAKGRCIKAWGKTTSATGIDIIQGSKEVIVPNPNLLSESQETLILDNADYIIGFVNAVRSRRHALAEQGNPTTGWKLVNKITHRKIKEGMHEQLLTKLKRVGLRPPDYTKEPETKSPAQIETALKNKGVAPDTVTEIKEKYFVKPDGGTNFVPNSKSGVPVRPLIETEFEGLFEDDNLLD